MMSKHVLHYDMEYPEGIKSHGSESFDTYNEAVEAKERMRNRKYTAEEIDHAVMYDNFYIEEEDDAEIENVEQREAMEALEYLENEPYQGYEEDAQDMHEDAVEFLKKRLIKAQQEHEELAEIKRKVNDLVNVSHGPNFYKIPELKALCRGSEK